LLNESIFKLVHESIVGEKEFVLVTTIDVKGSTPGKKGFRMVVFPDGSIKGTIGGGRIENEGIKEALRILETGEKLVLKDFDLLTELEMACGGKVSLMFESHTPYILNLVGAGHLAQAIAPLAKQSGFKVKVFDDREEFIKDDLFPPNVEITIGNIPECLELITESHRSYAIILTYSHEVDERALQSLIKKDLGYLGLIGSKRKAKKFKENLKQIGTSPEKIDFLRTPVGLPIGAKTPFEIAVSIVSELIAFRVDQPLLKWD
jgi:xanthine dehydrogenase accessory factor